MDVIEDSAGRAGYRQIATRLIDEIQQGIWSIGTKLPTEQALVERFGVSRNTVREALRELQNFGYLSKRRGARSEVIRAAPDNSFLNSIRSVDELLEYVHATHGTILSIDRVILLEEQARQAGAAPGSEWVRLQLIRRRDPAAPPFCYSEAYVAPKFAEALDHLGPSFDIHRAVEARYGIVIGRVIQEIEAITATEGVALKLQVAPGSPILLARTTFHSVQGDLVEIGLAHFAPGRYKMKIALDRRQPVGD
ncbi:MULTISPECIES: GntR family transcriptional regulator [unclassified Sphingobium]|uniref:GntR family transcriptional regulator n=1 Tax=unclassified Sphingobium TaxID=2611147 RepID=UPI0035A72116